MRATDEAIQIQEIVQRLVVTNTEIPADDVAKAVQDAYALFEGIPIREFVPLFVERRARVTLGQLAPELVWST